MKTEIVEFKSTEIYCPVDTNGNIFVAIKPICEALGVNFSGQIQRIKRDQILSQLCVSMHTTGRDSKQYEMACLPLQYVFGWLFSIDENAVKPEAKEQVLAYKVECHNVLYEHFVKKADRYKRQKSNILALYNEVDMLEKQKSQLSAQIKQKKIDIRLQLQSDPTQIELFEQPLINNEVEESHV